MLALYRCGRQAEGLDVYRRTRRFLNDELGLEPGVELQELERAILVQDPALQVADNGRARPLTPERAVCPFKGLAPFEAADAEFFFGRERLVDELVARLAGTQLLAIIGPSGSGKSSLLRAGLLPALERWPQVLLRPGDRPSFELPAPGDRLVIAVDQFEELFAASVSEDERRAFVDMLVDAAWDAERRALILIALRADFFGHLAPYVELADLVGPNHVLLGPMTAGELRRAIEGPVERAGGAGACRSACRGRRRRAGWPAAALDRAARPLAQTRRPLAFAWRLYVDGRRARRSRAPRGGGVPVTRR